MAIRSLQSRFGAGSESSKYLSRSRSTSISQHLADLRRFFNVVEIYISLRTGNRNEAARLAMSQFCNVALVETLDGLDRA